MCCRRTSGKQSRQARESSSRSAARRSGRSSSGGMRNSRPLGALKRSWQSGRRGMLPKTTAMCPQHGARQSDLSFNCVQVEDVRMWLAKTPLAVVLSVMSDMCSHKSILHDTGANNVRLKLMTVAESFSGRYPMCSVSQPSSSAHARLSVATSACCASGLLHFAA